MKRPTTSQFCITAVAICTLITAKMIWTAESVSLGSLFDSFLQTPRPSMAEIFSNEASHGPGLLRSNHRASLDAPPLAATVKELMETELEGSRHDEEKTNRLAILMPYLANNVPPYLSLFCMGAVGASSVADFIVPHNGILDQWPGRPYCPENVHFFDLGNTDNMVELMVTRLLNGKPEHKWMLPKDRLVSLVARQLEINPYAMVEYKGALGHIFQEYIPVSKYSHWAYSDFDIIFGDLERYISEDEFNYFDITTYGYGDQERLFLRGQFTMHKNDPDGINQLWRGCDFLSDIDRRFSGMANGESYRFESAEGCYSLQVLLKKDITVKYAAKAWFDKTMHSDDVFLTRSPRQSERHTLLRLTEEGARIAERDGDESSLPLPESDWFERDSDYQDYSLDLQIPTSDIIPIEDDGEVTDNCRLGWIRPEYRSTICVPPSAPVTNRTNILFIHGKRYMQHFEFRKFEEAGVYETGPYFHFMNLKRTLREGLFNSVLDPSLEAIAFNPHGGFPVRGHMSNIDIPNDSKSLQGTQETSVISSPLGVSMEDWANCMIRADCDIRSMLPHASYCYRDAYMPRKKYGMTCNDVVTWNQEDRVLLITEGIHWDEVNEENDVTLVLTAQIEVSSSRDSIKQWAGLIQENLRSWVEGPAVVLIHLAVAEAAREKAVQELMDLLSSDPLTHKALVAVVHSPDGAVVSRKAMLNMAIDAVPTRWYISGLEIERGLVLSQTTQSRALDVSHDTSKSPGQVYFIPQFALNSTSNWGTSLPRLVLAHDEGLVKHPWEFDKVCKAKPILVNETLTVPEIGQPSSWEDAYKLWWNDHDLFSSWFRGPGGGLEKSLKMLGEDFVKLMNFEESPILLTDNKGPSITGDSSSSMSIKTNLLAREVEEFSGKRCFNGLRLSQLAGFGYSMNLLADAYALSTPATREVSVFAYDPRLSGYSKCEGCIAFQKRKGMSGLEDEIARLEMERPYNAQRLSRAATTTAAGGQQQARLDSVLALTAQR